MREIIKKIFRTIFNSKKTTKKDYTNSEDLIKQRLKHLNK